MIEYQELTPDEQRLLQRAFDAHPKIITIADDANQKAAEDLQAFGYLRDAFLGWAITKDGRELVKDHHERTGYQN